MPWKRVLIRLAVAAVVVAALAVAIAGWPRVPSQATAGGQVWTCSMHPQIRLPGPGQCPICGMKLIPISQLAGAKESLEARAGLETEAVGFRELFKEIRTVGKLDYSERQVEFITSRVAGRVDRLFVDFTGLNVKDGDHLAEIYSPDLNVAQHELLIALEAREKEKPESRGRDGFAESRLESSRTKLRLLGILDEQIAAIEKTRRPTTHLTIYAPLGGTVIEKNIRVGQYVNPGDQLYKIANLDPIWLYLNVYERDVAWVRFGQPVEVTLEAFPGEAFRGIVTFVDPFLDDATRTIRARVNLKNPERRLKPQMYATATIQVPLRADGSPEPTGLEGKFICPMHPEIVETKPGICPICEMPLEKVPELPATKTPGPDHSRHQHGAAAQDHAAHKRHAAKTAETTVAVQREPGEKTTQTPVDKPGDNAELAIPVSAVLDTGRRQIAYRLRPDGAYELVELKLGPRARSTDDSRREYYAVLDGLSEGDRVVVQSGFLLDSQRQIEGMPSLLYSRGHAAGASGHEAHAGHGGPAPGPSMPPGHQH